MGWRLLLGGMVLTTLVVIGPWQWQRYQAAAHYQRAKEALQREDFELARGYLTESLRYRPEQAHLTFELARTERRANNLHVAKDYLKQAEQAGYDSDRIALETALLEAQQLGWRGKLDQFIARIDAHDPDAARIHEVLTLVFYAENLLEPGLSQIDRWLELEPHSPSAWETCGLLHERLGHAEKALAAYLKASTYDSERFPARLGAGKMAYARSQMNVAVDEFTAAVRLRHRDWEARIGLGRVLADLHRYDEAKAHVEVALVLEPTNYQVLGTAGRVALLSGRYTEAEKFFQAATATVGDAKILMDYRVCLARMNRIEEARQLDARIKAVEDDLDRIASLRAKMQDPNDPKPRVEAGRLLIKHGLYNEGRGWLQEALKVAPNYPPAHSVMAEMYEKLKRPDLAAYHHRQAGGKK